ncbi:hypothetical protein Emag_003903 [Eimeria magna]
MLVGAAVATAEGARKAAAPPAPQDSERFFGASSSKICVRAPDVSEKQRKPQKQQQQMEQQPSLSQRNAVISVLRSTKPHAKGFVQRGPPLFLLKPRSRESEGGRSSRPRRWRVQLGASNKKGSRGHSNGSKDDNGTAKPRGTKLEDVNLPLQAPSRKGPQSQRGNMKHLQEKEWSQQQQQGATMSLKARFSRIGISRHKKKVHQQQYHLQQEQMQKHKKNSTQRIEEKWQQEVEQKAQTQQKKHQQQQVELRRQQPSEEKRRLAEETVAEEELLQNPSRRGQHDCLDSADTIENRKRRWRRLQRRHKHHQQHGLRSQEEPEGQPPQKVQKQQQQHEDPEVQTEAGLQLQEQREKEHSQQGGQHLGFGERWGRRQREREKGKEGRRLRRLNARKPKKLSLTSAPQPPPHQQLQHQQQHLDSSCKANQQQRQHEKQHPRPSTEIHEELNFKRGLKLRRRHRRARPSKNEEANTPKQQVQECSPSDAPHQQQQQQRQGQRRNVEEEPLEDTVLKRRHRLGRRHRRALVDKGKNTTAQQQPQHDECEINEQHRKQMTELEIRHNQAETKEVQQQRKEVNQHQRQEKEEEQVSQRFQRAGDANFQLSLFSTPLNPKAQPLLPCGIDEGALYRSAASEDSATAAPAFEAATIDLSTPGAALVAGPDSKSKTPTDQTHVDEPAHLVLEAQEADSQQEQDRDCGDVQRGRHRPQFANVFDRRHKRRVPSSEDLPILERKGQEEEKATAEAATHQKRAKGGEEEARGAVSSPSVKLKASLRKHQAVPRGAFEVGLRKAAGSGGEAQRQPKPFEHQLQPDTARAASPRCSVGKAWSSIISATTSFFC